MIAIKGHFDGKVIVPDEPVDLPKDQKLLIHVEPEDSTEPGPTASGTAADLAASPLIGMWADRTDITDSSEYSRQLRRQAETRRRKL